MEVMVGIGTHTLANLLCVWTGATGKPVWSEVLVCRAVVNSLLQSYRLTVALWCTLYKSRL